ncbi:unnamed protein product [Toxocara canis]|uniref:CC domain-containing protein n=1 Tax=Toxocara canis TaxID=6265 RepID=A0A183UYX1_TOXCA|nr:unnamed protein product [Toxocara canis]
MPELQHEIFVNDNFFTISAVFTQPNTTLTICSQYGLQPISCINGCCCTVPTVPIIPTVPTIATITPPSVGLGYCYDGQRSEVRCTVRGQCAAEQTCMNNLCCPTTDKQYLYACGGIAALGSCSRNGSCSNSFVCTASNYCCECAFGRTGGFCSQGCAAGYTCSANGYCCPSCPNGEVPYGSCYNGMCASGYSCRPGNICCSGQTPLARYRFVDYHR